MTVRNIWKIVLIIVSIVSIFLNAFILSFLTDKHFEKYVEERYQEQAQQIVKYLGKTLSTDTFSLNQAKVELESSINFPIKRIKLYTESGDLIIDVGAEKKESRNKEDSKKEKNPPPPEDIKEYKIYKNNYHIGTLHIVKYSTRTSLISKRITHTLIRDSLISMVLTLVVSLILGAYISKKMSKDLKETAEYANDIKLGEEKDLKKSNINEIDAIRDSLRELTIRLKIKQKNRKELIDQLIHQTRTPLTILKSHIEGIEDGVIELNEREIAVWHNQITNITDIICNMSGMIDANSEQEDVKYEKVSLERLIQQIISGLKPQFDKKNIHLLFDDTNKILLETDSFKFSQIIYNLLTNAYKYTEFDGKVEIRITESNESKIYIEVEDSGIGIANENLDRIFDAYYRSSEVSSIKGEGIGLYVVKENLRLLGGEISVKSQLGVGTKFTIILPIKN